MNAHKRPSTAEWRDLIDAVRKSIPSPDEVLAHLIDGYGPDAVAQSERVADRMLLPRPCLPRISPASLNVLDAAHEFGCFFYTSQLRGSLIPPASTDTRWQSGYLQQHMVIETSSREDTNVEVHDLVHAMFGLMWWPGISRHDFYLASRLSEATAAYHYYFTDQVLEPRCATHRNIVDLARIWKFNICPDCNQERNRYYHLPEDQQAAARVVGLECIRQATTFYLTELQDIAKQAVEGVSFVERNPVNLSANAADALRYGHYMYPVLQHPRLEPYLDALRDRRRSGSFADYLHRATGILAMLGGAGPAADGSVTELRVRRQLAFAEDLLLRVGTVLAQHDTGARTLSSAEVEVLEESTARTVELAGDERPAAADELVRVVRALADNGGETGRAIASVGYEPTLALCAEPGVGHGTELAAAPDVTNIVPMLEHGLASALPRTVAYLRGAAVLPEVLAAFRESDERWAKVEASPGDGRVPHNDKLVQRFRLLLARLARADSTTAGAAATAHEIAGVEHQYARYQVQARADLDLRDEPVEQVIGDEILVRLGAATRFVQSTVDIDRPSTEDGGRRLTYVLSVTRDRTYLTRLPALLGELLPRFDDELVTVATVRTEIERLGATPDAAAKLVGQWLRLGVIVPQPGGYATPDDLVAAGAGV